MFTGWFNLVVATLLTLLVYFAFFWKINWVKDLRHHTKRKYRKVGKLPPVYPNGWFALLESSQLKIGQVKHVSALGENFAVFRTEKGVVNILDAYCPHLGANMGEGGRVKGECLECPFHSWLFRGNDGSCASIPYAQKVPSVAKTKAWKSCEVNEMIFVWYHAESATPDWQPQSHPYISDGTWRYQGRNEFLVNCHIQDIAENGADVAHLSAVHGSAFFFDKVIWFVRHVWTNTGWRQYASTQSDKDFANEEGDNAGSAEVIARKENKNRTKRSSDDLPSKVETEEEEEEGEGEEGDDEEDDEKEKKEEKKRAKSSGRKEEKCYHRASLSLRHNLLVLERFKVHNLLVTVEQIGPGYVELLMETTLGSLFIVQTVTPIEPLVQCVKHVIFSPRTLAPYANILFFAECLMFERDVDIWNHKRFEQRPILVREDRTIAAYRRWYSQFYSSNSPTYRSAMKSLQW